ncbi:dyslexia-associated protein KIAA0319-like protein [Trichogramma pretiosum]|uniref:dyslexia-associated protein KIAA0319-like protein n=1 Tax=Trichogramma pretiosum TaxID=7493 RepID=UPI000C71A376|nr:dyslexia-associated protein KIAA0319-like protein [Trichogramma pretiosum]
MSQGSSSSQRSLLLRLLLALLLLCGSNCYYSVSGEWASNNWQILCPALYPKVFTSYAPVGNLTGGVYRRQPRVTQLRGCVATCCQDEQCHVALTYNKTCYHLQCTSSRMCLPLYHPELAQSSPPNMVLVKPVEDDDDGGGRLVTWSDEYNRGNLEAEAAAAAAAADDAPLVTLEADGLSCALREDCMDNEVCRKSSSKSRVGICECETGYKRNLAGVCSSFRDIQDLNLPPAAPDLIEPRLEKFSRKSSPPSSSSSSSSSSSPKKNPLWIRARNQVIELPENSVSLKVLTKPVQERVDGPYKFAWTLLKEPAEARNAASLRDQDQRKVQLSNLSEGVYELKVTAKGVSGSEGEAYVNVTVLPEPRKRVNKPPVAVVIPSSQIVKLPNNQAVLDGSSSRDDLDIRSYHWEPVQTPKGYEQDKDLLVDAPTLQLDNLVAGNYTFQLTVEDSDRARNSTLANVTVIERRDYPPSADAGQNVVIHLPENSYVLNGNMSADDRGIVKWRWTTRDLQNKSLVMDGADTPYPRVSKLERGYYTFVLEVEDAAGQVSSSEVHVSVQPPRGLPPVADAGDDTIVALPTTEVTLNGSRSRDDARIVSYRWELVDGPTPVRFGAANESVTQVGGLSLGDYTFKLTVRDSDGNPGQDSVRLKVVQNKNVTSRADAGGNRTVSGPVSALVFNGSKSSGNLGIARWLWSRQPQSLAVGRVIEGTDESPVLMLADVVPGRYVFKLTIYDAQGEASEDTATVIVEPDPESLNLVELVLNVDAHLFTEAQKDALLARLRQMLKTDDGDDATIVVRSLRAEPRTNRLILVFFVRSKTDKGEVVVLPASRVVDQLERELRDDSTKGHRRMQLPVARLDTSICQNNCSGHGTCDQETRQCVCEAFWMQNFIKARAGDSNCDWSILYAIIGGLAALIVGSCAVWLIACCCKRACRCLSCCCCCWGRRRAPPASLLRPPSKKKPARYSLLADDDENTTFSTSRKVVLSDSDTDSDDVMFDKLANDKSSKYSKSRNGFLKSTRLKT